MNKIILLSIIYFSIIMESQSAEVVSERYTVSIAALLSIPEKYDKKVVRVVGAGKFGYESSKICLSMEDVVNSLVFNCLKLTLSSEQYKNQKIALNYDEQYILIEGVFLISNAEVEVLKIDKETGQKIETGALGIPYVGQITKIRSIRKWYNKK